MDYNAPTQEAPSRPSLEERTATITKHQAQVDDYRAQLAALRQHITNFTDLIADRKRAYDAIDRLLETEMANLRVAKLI